MRFILALGITLVPTLSWAIRDASDLSFNVDTLSTTTFVLPLLTDPLGRQTGMLGPKGPQVNNIPNSGYTVDSIDDEETQTPGIEGARVGIGPVAAGQYTLTLFGLAPTAYKGTIHAFHTDISQSFMAFQGFIVQNSSRQYVVNIDPAPGGLFSAVKTVTFDNLRQDLQTAFQLGLISGPGAVGIFKSLDAKLRAAQNAGAHGDNKTASNQLNAFINELKAQQGKHLATSTVATLQADAQALISKLGT